MAKRPKKKVKKGTMAPISLGEHDWYYVYPGHIILVHEIYDALSGGYVRTDQIKLPWRKLKTSLVEIGG